MLPTPTKPSRDQILSDLFAGIIGAIIVIPQAVTYAALAGVPAIHGLVCSIIVTSIAAYLGGSILMSGPNTATALYLATAVTAFATPFTSVWVDYVLGVSFLVGVFQMLLCLTPVWRLINHTNKAAMFGLTTGIGILIVYASIDDGFGINVDRSIPRYLQMLTLFGEIFQNTNLSEFFIYLMTITSGFLFRKFTPKYYVIISLTIGILACFFIQSFSPDIGSIAFLEQFSAADFRIYNPLPFMQRLADKSGWHILSIVVSAFGICLLSLSQTLVASKQYEKKFPQTDAFREARAIGIANFIGSFGSSFAGSVSFNRTQVNVEMGAMGYMAAIFTSLFIGLIVLFAGNLFALVPLSSLAGLLFIVGSLMAYNSFSQTSFLRVLDYAAYIGVLLTTIFIGLDYAMGLMIVASVFEAKLHNVRY